MASHGSAGASRHEPMMVFEQNYNPVQQKKPTLKERVDQKTPSLKKLLSDMAESIRKKQPPRSSDRCSRASLAPFEMEQNILDRLRAIGFSEELIQLFILENCISFTAMDDFELDLFDIMFFDDLIFVLEENKAQINAAYLALSIYNSKEDTKSVKGRVPSNPQITCTIQTLTQHVATHSIPVEVDESLDVPLTQAESLLSADCRRLAESMQPVTSSQVILRDACLETVLSSVVDNSRGVDCVIYDDEFKESLRQCLKHVHFIVESTLSKFLLTEAALEEVMEQLDALVESYKDKTCLDTLTSGKFYNLLSQALEECGHKLLVTRHSNLLKVKGLSADAPKFVLETGVNLFDNAPENMEIILRVLLAHISDVQMIRTASNLDEMRTRV